MSANITPVVFIGGGCGVGLALTARGLFPLPPPLARSIRNLQRTATSVEALRQADPEAAVRRLARRWVRRCGGGIAGRFGTRTQADLAIMGREPGAFAISKLATALALCGVPIGFAAALLAAGIALPYGFTVMTALAAAAIGFVTPDITVRTQAAHRREAFRHALSSYLDLVNVLLAGGAGVETSLEAAAGAGDGWAFTQLRTAFVRARTLRISPWECLEGLGAHLDIAELIEVAASVRLAGEQGARVKLSLAAKAASLRAHQMARIEAAAQSATERMGLPTVLMFLGFMVFLGYPAMQQIVGAL